MYHVMNAFTIQYLNKLKSDGSLLSAVLAIISGTRPRTNILKLETQHIAYSNVVPGGS